MGKKTRPMYMLSEETHLRTKGTRRLNVKSWKKIEIEIEIIEIEIEIFMHIEILKKLG